MVYREYVYEKFRLNTVAHDFIHIIFMNAYILFDICVNIAVF